MTRSPLLAFVLACVLLTQPVLAEDAVIAGELITEPATLIALGFEWRIQGDDSRNAIANIYYRKPGTEDWSEGLPLLRLQGEYSVQWDAIDYTAPNMFAGSVFDLEENTEYEVRLLLSDPDGASGSTERMVTVRTRAELFRPQSILPATSPATAGRQGA